MMIRALSPMLIGFLAVVVIAYLWRRRVYGSLDEMDAVTIARVVRGGKRRECDECP